MTVFRHTVNVDTGASSANLRELEQNSDRLERSLRSAEDRAGRFGTASTKLAGILGRISPALGESAMMANDLADGFEVATMGGARILAVLGPVAVAAGVLAGAYFALKGRLDEATESMEENAAAASRMQKLTEELSQASDRAAVARGDMTLEELVHTNAMKAGNDVFAERRQELVANVREQERLAAAASASFNQESQTLARNAGLAIDEQARNRIISDGTRLLEAQSVAVNKSNAELERARSALEMMEKQQATYVADLETINNANSSATSSTSAATDALEDYTAAVDDASDAVERLVFTTQEGLTSEEALFQNAEFVMQRLRGEISDDQFNELINPGGADRDAQAAAAAEAALKASQRQGDMSGIADGLGMLTNPSSALAMAGPVGAIVAGLSAVGTLGADGVEAQMKNLVATISAGIKALPEILIDVLPEIGRVIVTELPAAIFEALRSLFQELFDKITGIFGGGNGGILSDDGGLSFLEGTGVGNFGDDIRSVIGRSSSSRGRVARADGATRAAMSRAPTAAMMAQPNVTINALGIDDGTQDQFQRTFARYTDSNTGLRGRG